MSTETQPPVEHVEGEPHLQHSLMEIFDELSFRDKWRKVLHGLKQPKDSGDYKFAMLQIQRLQAPVASVAIPILLVLIMISVKVTQAPNKEYQVEVMEPEPIEELDKEIQKPEEKIEPEITEVTDNPNITDSPTDSMNESAVPGIAGEFSPQPANIDSVAMVKSPIVLKGILGSRNPGARGSALAGYGGSGATERAVLLALRWLKKNQQADGSWLSTTPAMTALALLTYLAHGETPASEEFGYTVEKAIRWLVENQTDAGTFKGADAHNYTQPIAAYALCEAYALTRIPDVKYAAEKAITFVVKGQNESGGWDYNCKKSERNDTSYMGWCAQALKAAKLSGVEVEGLEVAIKKAIQGFKGNYGSKEGYGYFGYTGPANSGLTGVGVLCMQLLGASKAPEVQNGINGLAQTTFNWEGGGTYNQNYYWYYITQAKFHEGGNTWNAWNKLFSPVLVKHQTVIPKAIEDAKGNLVDIGFWEMAKEISGHTDGVVMNTCLCALQLQVYYRYLPTFKTPQAEEAAPSTLANEKKDVDIKIL